MHELIALHFASDDEAEETVEASPQPDEAEPPEEDEEEPPAASSEPNTGGPQSKGSNEAAEPEAAGAAAKGWRLFVPKQALRSKSAVVQLDDAVRPRSKKNPSRPRIPRGRVCIINPTRLCLCLAVDRR